MVWTGLVVGILFGVVLQQGRICFNSAFRDIILIKDNYLLKLAAFALALMMLVFVLLSQFGLMVMNPKPLNVPANIIGGLLFGVGMVLAAGCASGTTYRVGEGLTTAWLAALSYGLSGYAAKAGAFKWLPSALSGSAVKVAQDPSYYVAESGPTIPSILGLNPWIPAVVIAALLIWYAFGTKTTERETKLGWKLAAVLLAVIAGIAFVTSSMAGRKYGLGITGGWINLFKGYVANEPLNWEGLEIIGIIIGSAVAAVWTKEFKLRMPKKPITYVQVLIGGLLMGVGAVTAGGCNIGHFLTGVPQLAISSIIASICFVLGNWAMTWVLYRD